MSEAGLEQKYINEAFETNWVVPLGPNVDGFEKALEDFVNENGRLSKRVVALSSGTAAVHLGLVAAGVKAGDEVLVQSFTFCASTHPITYLGATPVMIDSEPDTWNIDPDLLEEAIRDRIAKTGRKPAAIVPVALYGMPYRIDRIMEIANRYGIPVVEDAAEGFGSRYQGQVLGTFGLNGVLSFNGNKIITTSGGGALITADDAAWREVMMYATQYRESYPYYQHEKIGYNYRMSNICAGIGRGQMSVLESHLAHHRHVQQLYEQLFADVPGIEVHAQPAGGAFDSTVSLTTMSKPCASPSTRLTSSRVLSGSPCTSNQFMLPCQPMSMVSASPSSRLACVCRRDLVSPTTMCAISSMSSSQLSNRNFPTVSLAMSGFLCTFVPRNYII